MSNMTHDLREMIQFWNYGEGENEGSEVQTNFFEVPSAGPNQMTYRRFNDTRTIPQYGHL